MAIIKFNERRSGNVTILDLSEKVTIGENCAEFRSVIHHLLSEEKDKILLNMVDVSYIDSSGLGEIVSAYTTFEREGGSLKLLNLTKGFQDVLTVTKLLTVFDTFEDEIEAIRSFQPKTVSQEVRI